MKRWFTLILSVLLMVSMVGCSKETADKDVTGDTQKGDEAAATEAPSKDDGDKSYKIAMIYQDLSTEFNLYFQDTLKAKSEELGVELVEFDGQGDIAKQLDQCENAIEMGVDALMFIPVDKSGAAPIIDNCNASGIPVIGCNNVTDNIDDATAYVGANDIEAGVMEMEFMAEKLGGKGNICIVHGPFGHSAEVARNEGIMQVLEKYPDIKILYEDTANWDRTQAMDLMENWIQKEGNNINAVVCHSDDMGMGVVQAIQGAGLDGQIQVIGVDAIFDALNAVKSGEMAATVFQDVDGQAAGAITVAMQILKGESFEKTTYVPFQLVTKDNVDQYLKRFE